MKYLITTIAAVGLVGCGRKVDIWEAAYDGNIEAVKHHLDAGVDVNVKDEGGETPLHHAALKGHKEIAEVLITNGADLNAKDLLDDSTPLHWAAQFDQKEIVELLIAEGAAVNAKNMDGETPLHKAVPKEIVKLLIFNGADVNAKSKFGHTAIYLANLRNETETAGLLRKHGGKTGEELK